MKIILEAPDRCGKTSLYNELAKQFDLIKVGSISGETVKVEDKDKYLYYKGVTDAYISTINSLDNCIKDRCFISTLVYNLVYSRITFEQAMEDFNNYLNSFCSTKNPILIYIKSDYKTYCKRMHTEDDFDLSDLISKDLYGYTSLLFEFFINKCSNKFKIITFENYSTTDYSIFISEAKKKISSLA